MQPPQIHATKTPRRRHYIKRWAEKRDKTPTDIAEATGADKSLVSRWLNDGVLPREFYLEQLAELFETERDSLFRDPDDDWLAKFFKDKNEEERARAFLILKNAFPEKTGSNDR